MGFGSPCLAWRGKFCAYHTCAQPTAQTVLCFPLGRLLEGALSAHGILLVAGHSSGGLGQPLPLLCSLPISVPALKPAGREAWPGRSAGAHPSAAEQGPCSLRHSLCKFSLHTEMAVSKQAVGTWKGKGTVFFVVVCLFMYEVYLSPGFIPGHNHPVCCHLPSGVIFNHSYVMANTLWLLLPAVASTVSK